MARGLFFSPGRGKGLDVRKRFKRFRFFGLAPQESERWAPVSHFLFVRDATLKVFVCCAMGAKFVVDVFGFAVVFSCF